MMVRPISLLAVLAAFSGFVALGAEAARAETVSKAYPHLLNGALASAALSDLPDGVLLDMGTAQITQTAVDDVLAHSGAELKDQLRKNALFLVQEMATKHLLLRAARDWAAETEADIEGKSEPEIIGAHLQGRVSGLSVSDEEIVEFYAGNTDMFGGAQLKDVKDTLRQFLLKSKRQEATDEYVRTIAGTYGVRISKDWLATQAAMAMDNPVDKARASGKPSLVDFGSVGCRPCEMMAPILEELKKKYEGKANVLFVHVGENQVLAARFGIRSIPVQVFFDAEGTEMFRHTGFLAQDKMEAQLAELGVQ